jgi:hypothetical protein
MLDGFDPMFHSREASRSLGRWSCSVFKRWPTLFLVFPLIGVALGVGLIVFPSGHAALRVGQVILGAALALSYGALIVMHLVKRARGTWDDFCDWGHAIFED